MSGPRQSSKQGRRRRRALGERPGVGDVLERVSYVSDQFKTFGAQQRQQAFEQLKEQFQAQVQQIQRQQGAAAAQQPINVETMPEFQQEWLRLRVHLEQQFESHMDGYRNELRALV